MSRVLGAKGIGIYSYTLSIETYFAMFAAMGTLSYGSREIARNRNDMEKRSRLFFEIELMSVITTTVSLIAWGVLVFFYKQYSIYFLVLSLNLIAVIFDISWFFTGLEEFQYIVIRNTIIKLITVVLLFVLIRGKNDLVLYIGLMSAGTLVGNISMWVKLPKFIIKVDRKSIALKQHFKQTFIYFLPTIATSIYTVLDKTMIGLITQSDYQNGYYEQATKIVNLFKSVAFAAINSVMGARISYLFAQNNTDEIHQRIERSMDYIIFMGIGICFGLLGASKWFVPWFFGRGYGDVVQLLWIFSPIVFIIGISNCVGSLYYTPAGKRAQSAGYLVVGALVNVICNSLLIPHYGANGAAFASVIAELVISILYVHFSKGYMTFKLILKLSWKRLIAAFFMLVVILLIGKTLSASAILSVVQIAIGILSYCGALLILKDDFLKESLIVIKDAVIKMIKR